MHVHHSENVSVLFLPLQLRLHYYSHSWRRCLSRGKKRRDTRDANVSVFDGICWNLSRKCKKFCSRHPRQVLKGCMFEMGTNFIKKCKIHSEFGLQKLMFWSKSKCTQRASLIFVPLSEPPSPAPTTARLLLARPRAVMGLFMDSANGSIIYSSLAKPLIIQSGGR